MTNHPIVKAAGLRPGERVLEVGFRQIKAMRVFAEIVGEQGCVTGIDLDPKHVVTAQAAIDEDPHTNIHAVEGSILNLPFSDGAFDVVLCLGVLHEIRDVDCAVKEIARVLRPSGRAVIADFQRFSRFAFALYHIHVWLQGRTTFDVHPGFTRQSMTTHLRMHGLREISYETPPGRWRMGFIQSRSFLCVSRKAP